MNFVLSQAESQVLVGALVIAEQSARVRHNPLFALECAKLAERLRLVAAKDITQEVD